MLIVTVTFSCAPSIIEPAPLLDSLSKISCPVAASSIRYFVIQSPGPSAAKVVEINIVKIDATSIRTHIADILDFIFLPFRQNLL
jgi:hypothetical protein